MRVRRNLLIDKAKDILKAYRNFGSILNLLCSSDQYYLDIATVAVFNRDAIGVVDHRRRHLTHGIITSAGCVYLNIRGL